MGDNGWIKLDRDIQSHWVYTDAFIFKAWIDILLTANHKESKLVFDGNLLTIQRGQHLTSIRKISERWGCSRQKASKTLKMFADEHMIQIETHKRGTLLTVVNYGKYQNKRDTERTTEFTTEFATDRAIDVATDLHQTRMNKNDIKNDIRMKKNNSASGGGFFGGEWE